MWLTKIEERALGASAHGFAVFRVLLGSSVALCLGAGLSASSPATWLELPRMLRAALRVLALAASVGIGLGIFRRASAGVAIGAALTMWGFGFVAPSVAVLLTLLSGLVAWPALHAEPWVLVPSAAPTSDQPHPAAHFTTAAWAAFAIGSIATGALAPAPYNFIALASTLVGLGWLAVLGPARWLVLSLFALTACASALGAATGATLLLLACCFVAVIDEQWLPAASSQGQPIVFYDGVCGLCQHGIQLIVREDRHARLKLAPLQGETARQLLPAGALRHDPSGAPDSMLVHSGSSVLRESDGALFIAGHLGGVWRLFAPAYLLPAKLRNALYRLVARNRYTWFGKLDSCPVPDASVRARFLP